MPLYKQKGSNVWWISLSHPDHPRVRRSSGTTDRKEAQRFEDQLRAELWSTAPVTGRTWGQAVILWATAAERSESDIQSLAKFGRHYPDRQLAKVAAESLERALSFCSTAATYMRYRARIMAVLHHARDAGWLRDVPRMRTKEVKTRPRKWLTREEWDRLYVRLPLHQRSMAEFSLETGLRQFNVLSLTWNRVDLERRAVWVEAEDMKGGKAVAVPLSDRAVEILQTRQGAHEVFVFTYRGRPIGSVKTAFQRACVEAELGHFEGPKYQGFTWHGLRHTWATWHAQSGTPVEILQKLGAWADLRMVMNYAHHSPGYLAQFANNVRKR